jgi:hypothetical protein
MQFSDQTCRRAEDHYIPWTDTSLINSMNINLTGFRGSLNGVIGTVPKSWYYGERVANHPCVQSIAVSCDRSRGTSRRSH